MENIHANCAPQGAGARGTQAPKEIKIRMKGTPEDYLRLVDIFQKLLKQEGIPINDDPECEGWAWDLSGEYEELSVWVCGEKDAEEQEILIVLR